jgi:hypothetical protein
MQPRGELFAPISCCRRCCVFTSSFLCERGIVVHAKKYLKVRGDCQKLLINNRNMAELSMMCNYMLTLKRLYKTGRVDPSHKGLAGLQVQGASIGL